MEQDCIWPQRVLTKGHEEEAEEEASKGQRNKRWNVVRMPAHANNDSYEV